MVDVLNAERDLYSVKSNHAAARYQYVLAGLQLKQAAGILSEEDLAKINGWLR
jgi:outer membrane protein